MSQEKISVLRFAELMGNERLMDIMQKIADGTGMGIAAVDHCGKPVAGNTGYSSYCSCVQMDPEHKRICEASTGMGEIQAVTANKPYLYVCPHGLLEVTIPIVADGEFIGGLIAGQIRCDDIPEEIDRMERIFPQDKACREVYAEEFSRTTQMDFETFKAMAHMIYFLLKEIFDEKAAGLRNAALSRDMCQDCREVRALREDEIVSMRLRLDNRFILRNIAAIGNMAVVERAEKTSEMAALLSKFLYENIDEQENAWFLRNEMDMLECYFKLMQCQMDGLEYEFDVPEELMTQKIPAMLLFPAVEQAVYCGLRYKPRGGSIRIKIREAGSYIRIWITDDGFGMEYHEVRAMYPQIVAEYHQENNMSGVDQVKKRLNALFAEGGDISMELHRRKGAAYFIQYPQI